MNPKFSMKKTFAFIAFLCAVFGLFMVLSNVQSLDRGIQVLDSTLIEIRAVGSLFYDGEDPDAESETSDRKEEWYGYEDPNVDYEIQDLEEDEGGEDKYPYYKQYIRGRVYRELDSEDSIEEEGSNRPIVRGLKHYKYGHKYNKYNKYGGYYPKYSKYNKYGGYYPKYSKYSKYGGYYPYGYGYYYGPKYRKYDYNYIYV
jgi:hypothetical protein